MRRRNASSVALALALTVACDSPRSDKAPAPGASSPAVPLASNRAALPAVRAAGPLIRDAAAPLDAGYEFTTDWFTARLPVWKEFLLPYRDKPVHYLEVGVFEGRSALWMLDNVLTHGESRLTAVDAFSGEIKARWLENLARSGKAHKATTLAGLSNVELRKLPLESFDIVYIDGSHTADDVMTDAVLCFGLLKNGGLLVFDDYGWSGYSEERDNLTTPDELRPKLAIDAFLRAFRNQLDVVHHDFQVIVKKRPHACSFKEGCSPLGPYVYLWWQRKLKRPGSDEAVELSDKEIELVESTLRARAAAVPPAPNDAKPDRPEVAALFKKLGIER